MFVVDLVGCKVVVIVIFGSMGVFVVVCKVIVMILIVFLLGFDLVVFGLVESLNCFGGNVIGIILLNVEFLVKWFGIFCEFVFGLLCYFMLVKLGLVLVVFFVVDFECVVVLFGICVEVFEVDMDCEIDVVFV